MKTSKSVLLLLVTILSLSTTILKAQTPQYSKDQIIGNWILKSASYNGRSVPVAQEGNRISFEFSPEGIITFKASDGTDQVGMFMIKENKIIDLTIPEQPKADILDLSDKELVLEMKEGQSSVIMTFELDEKKEEIKTAGMD